MPRPQRRNRSQSSGGSPWTYLCLFASLAALLICAPVAAAVTRGLRKRQEQQQPEPLVIKLNGTVPMTEESKSNVRHKTKPEPIPSIDPQPIPSIEPQPKSTTVTLAAVPPYKVGRVSVPHSDLTLSRIAYGSLHFPEFEDDVEGLTAALEACQEVGVTTIDLADVYGWYEDGQGSANDIFAKALKAKPSLRANLELVVKFGIRLSGGYHIDLSPEWIHESMDKYLKLFGTKYVDVFMIHNPDPNMDVEAIAKAFKEIKEAGKAKAFGISNFHQWEYEALRDAMAKEGLKLSVHEMETSVLHPDRISDETVDYFSTGENEMRILGWGALGGDPYGGTNLLFGSQGEREKRIVSTLTQKGKELALEEDAGNGKKQVLTFEPDEVAVAWLLHHNASIVPIIGTTAVARLISQTIPAEKIPFRNTDFDEIMAALHY
eukprot:evm.model.NODE_22070_length_83641_cov_42.053585.32